MRETEGRDSEVMSLRRSAPWSPSQPQKNRSEPLRSLHFELRAAWVVGAPAPSEVIVANMVVMFLQFQAEEAPPGRDTLSKLRLEDVPVCIT